jgi:hypothetical protein
VELIVLDLYPLDSWFHWVYNFEETQVREILLNIHSDYGILDAVLWHGQHWNDQFRLCFGWPSNVANFCHDLGRWANGMCGLHWLYKNSGYSISILSDNFG